MTLEGCSYQSPLSSLLASQAGRGRCEEATPCQPGFSTETYTFTARGHKLRMGQRLGKGKRASTPVLRVFLCVAGSLGLLTGPAPFPDPARTLPVAGSGLLLSCWRVQHLPTGHSAWNCKTCSAFAQCSSGLRRKLSAESGLQIPCWWIHVEPPPPSGRGKATAFLGIVSLFREMGMVTTCLSR